jgi:aminoglycoside phosphotransferase (APT) family kinase protein
MTEVCGDTLENMWDRLSRTELMTAAKEIGSLTLALHQLPTQRMEEAELLAGGREEYIREEAAKRQAEIEEMEHLSASQKDELLQFLTGEARGFLDVEPLFTHSDFSHAHVYLTRKENGVKVSSFIDWGETMLGPPEWDTTFHWFWTFSGDQEAMRECLKGYYPDGRLPDQFARRCFSVHLYSYSMRELWRHFAERGKAADPIVETMIAWYFPPEVFGPPD